MNSFWQDRPTFITGGTGLVGCHLVRRLVEHGADVVCLVRDWVPQSPLLQQQAWRDVRLVRGDVCDQALLERVLGEYEIDTVIHLAAQTIVGVANRNAVATFESNVAGTWSLLEACRRSPLVRQIVTASSDKAYGSHEDLPYHEETPLNPRHPYDVSKACADLISRSYAETFELNVAITRCGNFYGAGDLNWSRLIPGTIRSILRGQPPLLRSDGSYIRDYFYVEDGAAAYMLLAEQLAQRPDLRGEAFNFSNEIQIPVIDVVREVLRMADSHLQPVILNQAEHEIRHQFLDATKARTVLQWRPLFSLQSGLQRTVQWYRTFLEQRSTDVLSAQHPWARSA